MTVEEARERIASGDASYADQVEAVATLAGTREVELAELVRCLRLGGYPAELAAIELYKRTGRPRPTVASDFVSDAGDWISYLNRQLALAQAC